jgi:fatty acid synthase
MQKDIERGVVKPLVRKTYPAAEIEQAFRFLASGKHIGKVLLQIREDEHDEYSLPVAVNPQIYCNSKLSYVSKLHFHPLVVHLFNQTLHFF